MPLSPYVAGWWWIPDVLHCHDVEADCLDILIIFSMGILGLLRPANDGLCIINLSNQMTFWAKFHMTYNDFTSVVLV